jgi:tetratricopeptide (TPR) repeat protein
MFRVFLGLNALLFSWLIAAVQAQTSDSRIEELYAQAKAAQSHGDFASAIASYESILKIAPKLGPAYNNLGSIYFSQRDFQKAIAILTRGLTIDPTMVSASALLGIALYQTGEYSQARTRLETVLRSNPKDNAAQLYLAKTLLKLNDGDAAAANLKQLAARDTHNQEVWYLLAHTYMKLSEESLAKMNSIDPNSVWAHELSGEVMESMNNYDGAIVELKKAVEIAPRRPGVHYKLGDAYWTQSQWDAAAEQFQAELAIDPANCAARWKIGNIGLQKNGDPLASLSEIDTALAQCPSLTDARVDRSRALMKLNRNEEAAGDLLKAVAANPSDAGNHFLLAKAYRAMGKTREAQAEMQLFSQLEEAARAATAERAREVIKNKEVH